MARKPHRAGKSAGVKAKPQPSSINFNSLRCIVELEVGQESRGDDLHKFRIFIKQGERRYGDAQVYYGDRETAQKANWQFHPAAQELHIHWRSPDNNDQSYILKGFHGDQEHGIAKRDGDWPNSDMRSMFQWRRIGSLDITEITYQ